MKNQLAIISVTACAMLAGSALHAQIEMAPTGPYAVGRQAFVWIDSTRKDPADTTRPREVSAWIWYPANLRKDTSRAAPLPAEWESQRLRSLRTKLGPDIADTLTSFAVHSHTNAPLLSGTTKYPVLVFTPGLSWLATDYSVLIEDLASHGYIVAGYSPTDFSDPVVFPDGRVVKRSMGDGPRIGEDQSWIHDDGVFVLKKVREIGLRGFLQNRVDLTRIGAFGHSIGGVTSFVLAARDTSVRAAVNIDGDVMGDSRDVRPHQPILFINSGMPTIDESPPDWPSRRVALFHEGLERSEKRRTDEWTNLSSQSASAHRVLIAGTRHLNFTDAALASAHATSSESRWMKFGTIDPARGLAITSELLRAFFDEAFAGGGKNDSFTAAAHHFREVKIE